MSVKVPLEPGGLYNEAGPVDGEMKAPIVVPIDPSSTNSTDHDTFRKLF